MKSCILILLLGFDEELQSIIERFSSPAAKRQDFTYRSVINDDGTEPIDSLTNRYYLHDKLTILRFELDPGRLPLESELPKYQTCFIVSLVEPYPAGIINAHQEIFYATRKFIESTPEWLNKFKIAIKHHSSPVDALSVGFDWRLLQNLVFPGTYTKGFEPGKVLHPADSTQKRTISLSEAHEMSSIISDRIGGQRVTIDILAKWIFLCLPQSCVPSSLSSSPSLQRYPFQCWNAVNPLRITLHGCYAGYAHSSEEEALITRFGRELGGVLVGAHIRIIGMITWTFYANWRAASASPYYMEHHNPDPFRGAVKEGEDDFFVHASHAQETRRGLKFVTIVTPESNGSSRITYLPLALERASLHFSFDPIIEQIKILILFKLSEIFVTLNDKSEFPTLPRYSKIPPDISTIMRDINSNVVVAFTLDALRAAQLQILAYLFNTHNKIILQANTPDRNFTLEYINQLYQILNHEDIRDYYVKVKGQHYSVGAGKKEETLRKKFEKPAVLIESGKFRKDSMSCYSCKVTTYVVECKKCGTFFCGLHRNHPCHEMLEKREESTIDKSQHSMQKVLDELHKNHQIKSWNDRDPLDS